MRIDDRPRLLSELAAYYKVSRNTMRKWLKGHSLAHIRPETGNYYSIAQVKMIVEHLGKNE
jgi:hypothetical protein